MSSRAISAWAVALVLFTSASVSAQSLWEGYAVGSAGGWTAGRFSGSSLFGGAVGVEVMPNQRFGIGGEAAALTNTSGGLMLAFSGNARVHFPSGSRATPFVGGGYSGLGFFEGRDDAFNVSGGFDYRLTDRRAIRVEVRDFIRPTATYTAHYWGIRVGVTFR